MWRVFSIFRVKLEGPNPSEMDTKVFILAPTFCFQIKNVYSRNVKILVRKIEIKLQNEWLNNENSTIEWQNDIKNV